MAGEKEPGRFARGALVQRAGTLEPEAWDLCVENPAGLFVPFVGTFHRSYRSRENGSALVAVFFARIEEGLFSYDPRAIDRLHLPLTVGDGPVATLQLHAGRTLVGDGDEVCESVSLVVGLGVIFEVERLDRHPNAFGDRSRHGKWLTGGRRSAKRRGFGR